MTKSGTKVLCISCTSVVLLGIYWLIWLLTDFLSKRKQRVVLIGQHSSWADIEAGVPQGSILGPLIFLVYINDLTKDLHSNPKFFADDTSLFLTIADEALSNPHLKDDLSKINDWVFKWKMSFNPDSMRKKLISTTPRLHLTNFLLSAFNLTNI